MAISGYWLLAVGSCWPLAAGRWLLAIGYWLLAIGYWLLAIGYWLLAIGHRRARNGPPCRSLGHLE
jgi:hypothetical protein